MSAKCWMLKRRKGQETLLFRATFQCLPDTGLPHPLFYLRGFLEFFWLPYSLCLALLRSLPTEMRAQSLHSFYLCMVLFMRYNPLHSLYPCRVLFMRYNPLRSLYPCMVLYMRYSPPRLSLLPRPQVIHPGTPGQVQ